jgi:phage terminase Nu1 subunit (DNA packaging protein)
MPTHAADLSKLSISQLAAVSGFDRRTVRARLRGLEPVEQTGRELRCESREALAMLYTGDALELNRERARLASAQAVGQTMKNAELRRELVRGDQVEAWFVKVCSELAMRLRTVPSKAAPEAHGAETIAACEGVIRKHQDAALEDAAAARWIGPPPRARAVKGKR